MIKMTSDPRRSLPGENGLNKFVEDEAFRLIENIRKSGEDPLEIIEEFVKACNPENCRKVIEIEKYLSKRYFKRKKEKAWLEAVLCSRLCAIINKAYEFIKILRKQEG